RYSAEDGFFADFVTGARAEGEELPESLRSDLAAGAFAARRAYEAFSSFLGAELLPHAGEHDAVGRELYALSSRRFLGAVIDLDETYEWGREELARMIAEQTAIANEIA